MLGIKHHQLFSYHSIIIFYYCHSLSLVILAALFRRESLSQFRTKARKPTLAWCFPPVDFCVKTHPPSVLLSVFPYPLPTQHSAPMHLQAPSHTTAFPDLPFVCRPNSRSPLPSLLHFSVATLWPSAPCTLRCWMAWMEERV